MKAKVISFFIISTGVFLVLYFIGGEANLTQRVLFSVLSGLVFALIEAPLKRATRFIFNKSTKHRKP